ncbi:Hpt domain-containing protein [Gillisia sp. Hel_I_29]|uniref:Hpt domain-containing protein n=1 Tax=Gillisia sp. Hel_I_29 TaxID=1249975 RepID=UPI00054F4A75|nr:hypothetical protein [Gillisia sp. Hel_I_29]
MNNLPQNDCFQVLLIERSEVESMHFIDVMNKHHNNVCVEVCKNSFDAVQWVQENNADVIIIEEDAQPMSASQTIDYLMLELNSETPVFVTATSSQERYYQNLILKPFTERSLVALFDATSVAIKAEEISLYSLNYLMDISDGDTDFIMETLDVFKSSVKEKIRELDAASKEGDKKEVGGIAHNIKPSFEMLENEEGTSICNELTYYKAETAIPELVARLKLIFEEIVEQIDADFSTKNI